MTRALHAAKEHGTCPIRGKSVAVKAAVKIYIPLFVFSLLSLPFSASADTFGTGVNQFNIDFVLIGDFGNSPDTTGYGGVAYAYRIGTYEVSRGMIESYNALSGGPQITMADMSSVGGNGANRPATGITWNMAARFVNWLNTSKGHAAAYRFSSGGANDDIVMWTPGDAGYDPKNPYRNSRAHYSLPSENEWYKAAYYDPKANGGAGGFWDYTTGSNAAPTAVSSGTASGTAVFGGQAGPADIMNAGGLSPYGTMAQGGNVWERIESDFSAPNDDPTEYHTIRAGYWGNAANSLQVTTRVSNSRSIGSSLTGFRVVSVPPDQDHDGLADIYETGTGIYVSPTDSGTNPSTPDTDGDGLTDGIEVYRYGTNPNLADADEDGFDDSFEISTGFDPNSNKSTPDALSTIRTAVEFRFNAANGVNYRIEASDNLTEWGTIETNIVGPNGGGVITRFYSTENIPKRYFRARRN